MSFIDLDLEIYEMEQVYDSVKVLKSFSRLPERKICDRTLKDINNQRNQNISFNIFGELLETAEAFVSNRNTAIKNIVIKINPDLSNAVNVI